RPPPPSTPFPYTTLFRSHGLDHARIRVPDVEAADAAGEVDEGVPVDVGQGCPLATLDHDRQEDGERLGDHTLLPFENLLRAGAGDRKSTRLNSSHVAISY